MGDLSGYNTECLTVNIVYAVFGEWHTPYALRSPYVYFEK